MGPAAPADRSGARQLSGQRRRPRARCSVSLVADVMDSYFQLLEQDSELDISRKTAATAHDSLRIVRTPARSRRGFRRSTCARPSSCSTPPTARIAAARARHRADAKTSSACCRAARPTPQPRGRKLEEIPVPAQAPPGLPSALLERRPDIRAGRAEPDRRQRADRRGARALLSADLADARSPAGRAAICSIIVTAPGARLHRRALGAAVDLPRRPDSQPGAPHRGAAARNADHLPAHASTPPSAKSPTRWSASTACARSGHQQEQLVSTLEDTVRLSELRYRGGLDSYLQVLDAQRNLFSGQLALAQLRLQERVAVVQIYRALGGGWTS